MTGDGRGEVLERIRVKALAWLVGVRCDFVQMNVAERPECRCLYLGFEINGPRGGEAVELRDRACGFWRRSVRCGSAFVVR
jgi:hypothetical protein